MQTGFVIDETALAKGERLFRQDCVFVAGVQSLDAVWASDLPEVAFAGRSNVGKSTLINTLTGRKALARASQTPGRTQQINFFDLGGEMTLVDLPGYGYARASKAKIFHWTDLVNIYLQTRTNLRRVCVLIDARQGIKDVDRETMKLLDKARVPWLVILTKCDKVNVAELARVKGQAESEIRDSPGAFPKVYETSSAERVGIAELRAILAIV